MDNKYNIVKEIMIQLLLADLQRHFNLYFPGHLMTCDELCVFNLVMYFAYRAMKAEVQGKVCYTFGSFSVYFPFANICVLLTAVTSTRATIYGHCLE